jgi:sugar phosphate isomerase/epimerase
MSAAVISTVAFAGTPAEEIVRLAVDNGFALEFSSGMPYRADMEKLFLEAPVKKLAHNYFPAPAVPFVLNLGSADDAIRKRSVEHCIHGIRLSEKAGAPFFSAHAGFCVDPKPEELGRQLEKVKSFDRTLHWKYFLGAVREVLEATDDSSTGFLLENNVLARMNVYDDGSNPAFCVDAEEMLRILQEVSDKRLGLLLDTAHLKVSALTLGFDCFEAAKKVLPFTRCVHHSDNEGQFDNNRPFTAGYWFLPLMKEAANAVHVLEVLKQTPAQLKEMDRLLWSEL